MARICVVTQDPALGGGVLTKLTEFLHYAEVRGHTCDLYFPREQSGAVAVEDLLQRLDAVERMHPVPISGKLPHHLRGSQFGRRCEIHGWYDAYHAISGSLWHALPLVRRRRTFVSSIACTFADEVRGLRQPTLRHRLLYNPVASALTRRQERRCGRHAAAVLVDSRCSARHVHEQLGVAPERIEVVPAPIDVDVFRPGQVVTEPRPYVLSVGRLDRRKDFPTLIGAFARVARRDSRIELRIIGEGKERARITRLIGELGMAGRIRLLGQVSAAELRRQYQGASLFTLASRQEGIGIVLLEALASGLPIVATDSGGSRDPVEHGETGLLTPIGDPVALANSMLVLLERADMAVAMRQSARRKAMTEYARDVIHQRLDGVFGRVFGLRPGAGSAAAA